LPAIAHIGSVVTVTPLEEVQIVHGPGNHESIDDRSSFQVEVSGLIEEKGEIIGVHGKVISGHQRYCGLIATLLLRLDNSDWRKDNQSHAQFKVGRSPARPNGKYPFYNPDGTDIDGYPVILRFASIDSRAKDEEIIDSATEAFRRSRPPQSGST
jgi:hypothetical protein